MNTTGSFQYRIWLILLVLAMSSCMHMGKRPDSTKMKPTMRRFVSGGQTINTRQVFDHLVEEAVSDLSRQELDIGSLAVWGIRSQATGIDVEGISQKLLTQLVGLDRFKVISRERLSELLDEQNLSLTGSIDSDSAVKIGNLVGVEGFIDGYLSVDDAQASLSLSLTETASGVIVWAKTLEGRFEQ